MKALSVLICVSLLTASCGFHLRGATRFSEEFSRIHVSGLAPNDQLAAILFRQLRANGASVVTSPEATMTINVTHNEQGRRVLSVNRQGKVREFQLYYVLGYELDVRDGGLEVEPQKINLTRDFIFDENDVLGKGQEEALLFQDMRNDVVRLLIYRLQTIGTTTEGSTTG